MAPAPSQLAAEAKGKVFVYAPFKIDQVDAAMNVNLDSQRTVYDLRWVKTCPAGPNRGDSYPYAVLRLCSGAAGDVGLGCR